LRATKVKHKGGEVELFKSEDANEKIPQLISKFDEENYSFGTDDED